MVARVQVDETQSEPVVKTGSSVNRVPNEEPQKKKRTEASSTDPVSSWLTRRFGLAGGLAWLGVLAAGSLGEQVKTRLEVAEEAKGVKQVVNGKEVVLSSSGVSYIDMTIGGGALPQKGYLAVVDFVGKADGVVFEDTISRGKSIVFFFKGRPFTGGLCAGVEEAMSTMKAGGRRIIKVPAGSPAGFGASGFQLRPTTHVDDKAGTIPPGAALEYDLTLKTVSIPPS